MKMNYTWPEVLKWILVSGLVLAGLKLAILSFGEGLKRTELAECRLWEVESREYSANWYSAQWQKDQCRAYGIVLK